MTTQGGVFGRRSCLAGGDFAFSRGMSTEKRQQEFLNKAKEAEEQAIKVRDPESQATWRKIAKLYRELAKKASAIQR